MHPLRFIMLRRLHPDLNGWREKHDGWMNAKDPKWISSEHSLLRSIPKIFLLPSIHQEHS
jgi:hypothetical protein